VTLADYSNVALEKAKLTFQEYGLSAKFIRADIFDLKSLHGTEFDLVWNSGVMEHFNDEELSSALTSIKELNAPKFLFLVPNPHSVAYLLMRFNLHANNKWVWGTEYIRENYENFLKQAGMSVAGISYCGEEISKHHALTGGLNESGAQAYAALSDNNYLPDSEKYLIGYMTDVAGLGNMPEAPYESESPAGADIISLRTQLFEVLASNQGLTNERNALYSQSNTLTEECHALNIKADALTEECHVLSSKVFNLTGENQLLINEGQALSDKNQVLTDEKQSLTGANQVLTYENQSLTGANQVLTDENQALSDANKALSDENRVLTAENQTLRIENQALINENQSIHTSRTKALTSIENIAEHTNAISVRMNNKSIRRWLRMFDVIFLMKHSGLTGKLKLSAKIALRCIGIKKYRFPTSPGMPTEHLNSNLYAISASIEEIKETEAAAQEGATPPPGTECCTENSSAASSEPSSDSSLNPLSQPSSENPFAAAEQDFLGYKNERGEKYPLLAADIGIPCIKGLVSIVLPVYNGGDLLAESIESVLAQTYSDFELIIVDDGSTDETPKVIERYASADLRIRVITQKNQKLPQALSNGFDISRGEYFTWTSADNNMHPDCIERLVAELKQNRQAGMVYANINLIDENGAPMLDFSWYPHPEFPAAVMYPHSTSTLNLSINNTVGAAFMYRAGAAHAIGGYSTHRFTVEDLDYWLRINELFNLQHTSFEQPVYDYRWHSNSLTAKRDELKIDERANGLLEWDLFRRYLLLRPLRWKLHGFDANNPLHIQFANALVSAGHSLIETDEDFTRLCSYSGAHIIYFSMSGSNEASAPPSNCYSAYISSRPSVNINKHWHCLISQKAVTSSDNLGALKGWYNFADGKDMFSFLDIRAKLYFLQKLESRPDSHVKFGINEICSTNRDSENLVSIIIPVYKVEPYLERCVRSVINQSYKNLEIILVDDGSPDNCPALCDAYAKEDSRIKVIHKPNGGLSDARNAGIELASGSYLAFVDSDDWIESDMIEFLLSNALQYGADISECSFFNVYEDCIKPETEGRGTITVGDSMAALEGMLDWRNFFPMAWTKLYRAEIFAHIRYPAGKVCEDEFTTHKCYLAARKIVSADTCKYYYDRIRTDSITGGGFKLSYLDTYYGFEERLHYFLDNKFSKLESKMIERYSWTFFDRVYNCYKHNLQDVLLGDLIHRGLLNINRIKFENRPIRDCYLHAASLLEESIAKFAGYWVKHHVPADQA